MMVHLLQAHKHGKYANNGKDWYFQIDDDDKVSYEYIPSIT